MKPGNLPPAVTRRSWRTLALATCAAALGACSSGSAGHSPAAGGDGAAPTDGGAADAPLACPPAPLDEWAPPAYHHAQPRQPAACSTLLINDFYQSCLGPTSSNDSCQQTWGAGADTAHQTCEECLVTPSSATAWGPLVSYAPGGGDGGSAGGTVSVNVAGCVELLDPTQLSCATSAQQADECEHQACDTTCPVSDSATFQNWQACIAASAACECNTYDQAAACVNAEDAGPAAACVDGQTFSDQFLAVATVFCGTSGGGGD